MMTSKVDFLWWDTGKNRPSLLLLMCALSDKVDNDTSQFFVD